MCPEIKCASVESQWMFVFLYFCTIIQSRACLRSLRKSYGPVCIRKLLEMGHGNDNCQKHLSDYHHSSEIIKM